MVAVYFNNLIRLTACTKSRAIYLIFQVYLNKQNYLQDMEYVFAGKKKNLTQE